MALDRRGGAGIRRSGRSASSRKPKPLSGDALITALSPFSWIRADYYAETSGKVSAFLDKARPGHSLTQGTVANQALSPTVDSALGGQLAVRFTGAQQYLSSLPVASWSFFGLLNKSYTVAMFFRPTSAPSVNELLLATRPAAGGAGMQMSRGTNTSLSHQNQKTSVGMIGSAVGAVASGTPALWIVSASGPANKHTGRLGRVELASGPLSSAPDGVAQAGVLCLGARNALNSPSNMAFADLIVFDRQLSAPEIASVEAYGARYGL